MDWTARKTTIDLPAKDGTVATEAEVACFTLKPGEKFDYLTPCRVVMVFAKFTGDGKCTVGLSSGGVNLANPNGHAIHHFTENHDECPVVSFVGTGTCEVELTVIPGWQPPPSK